MAATAGFFALGSYLGRGLGYGWGFVFFIVAFGCLIGMQFAARNSPQLSVALLFGLGLSLGLAISPTVVYYASADPQALWQAGGATALFVAGCGAFGYATRTDLSGVARVCFWALLALIIFGVVLIFVSHSGRGGHLFDPGVAHFCRSYHGRLSAASAIDGSAILPRSSPRRSSSTR